MIEFRITLAGRSWRALGGLGWTNLDAWETRQAEGRQRTRDGQRPPLKLLRRAMQSRHARTGVCLQDAAEPPNWMFGHAPRPSGEAVSALVWLARANPAERLLYVHQQEAGPTWLAACDQGRIALSPEVDALVGTDQALRAAIDGLLEHWTSEEVPFRVVLNLRNRITTPMLERAVQRGLASAGRLEDLLASPPPPEARLRRLLPMPLGHALVIAAAAALALWWAGDWYWTLRERQREQAEIQRQLLDTRAERSVTTMDAAQQDAMAQDMAVRSALLADTRTLSPQGLLVACANLLQTLTGRVAAWDLDRIECAPDGQVATVHWRLRLGTRDAPGTHADFGALDPTVPLRFHADYQHVVASFPLQSDPLREGLLLPGLPAAQSWLRALGEKVQLLRIGAPDAAATISEPEVRPVEYQVPADPAVERTAGPKTAAVDPARAYLRGRIQLSGRGPLALVGMNLTEPNLSLSKISISPEKTSWIWHVELAYYCRP